MALRERIAMEREAAQRQQRAALKNVFFLGGGILGGSVYGAGFKLPDPEIIKDVEARDVTDERKLLPNGMG